MIFDSKQQQTNNFKVLLFIESLNNPSPKKQLFLIVKIWVCFKAALWVKTEITAGIKHPALIVYLFYCY